MGISGDEGYVRHTITREWWDILCMGTRWMTMNCYIGRGPWQRYHTPKITIYRANLWIVRHNSHDGDIRCWRSCRANYGCPVMKHTLYGSQMDDDEQLYWACVRAIVTHTKIILDRVNLCMMWDVSDHNEFTQCWGSWRTNHLYLVMKHTLYGS